MTVVLTNTSARNQKNAPFATGGVTPNNANSNVGNPKLTSRRFGVIVADCPWQYDNPGATAGGIGTQYPTLSVEELMRLPIAHVAEKDSFLFLWATMPKLPEAVAVMQAWGFRYKTVAFVWIKQNPKNGGIFSGLGYYTNGNAELVLLGTKGRPKRIARNVKQIVTAPRGRHSEKPDEVRRRIEQLTGVQNTLELFGRKLVAGWTVLGNEVTGRDICDDLNRLLKGGAQ
jgi:site-specific DNA-methyltransferase (adenine-specific)